MLKKEASENLLKELRKLNIEVNQGFADAIIDDVYSNKYNYKFFIVFKYGKNYEYNLYMYSEWNEKTQNRYNINKRKTNAQIEIKFEKRTLKEIKGMI